MLSVKNYFVNTHVMKKAGACPAKGQVDGSHCPLPAHKPNYCTPGKVARQELLCPQQ